MMTVGELLSLSTTELTCGALWLSNAWEATTNLSICRGICSPYLRRLMKDVSTGSSGMSNNLGFLVFPLSLEMRGVGWVAAIRNLSGPRESGNENSR